MIFVLADGLRPDAVSPSLMPSLDGLASAYTRALYARTVRPSATVAALASLATGVGPKTHRLTEPGLGFLPKLGALRPVARELGKRGIAVDIVTGELGTGVLPVAWALATTAGARRLLPAGRRARDTAAAAYRLARESSEGLLFVYLPDCDRAGHAHGWMTGPYVEAAAEVDAAIGLLSALSDETVFVIVADHGGGGVHPRDHDEPHPTNDHIPLILAGPGVHRRHHLARAVSLLDLPATILWWFGCAVPASYEGRVLAEAFRRTPSADPVPA